MCAFSLAKCKSILQASRCIGISISSKRECECCEQAPTDASVRLHTQRVMKTYAPASPSKSGGSLSDSSEWFSVEELETARENYLMEQEKDLPSPQVRASACACAHCALLVH